MCMIQQKKVQAQAQKTLLMVYITKRKKQEINSQSKEVLRKEVQGRNEVVNRAFSKGKWVVYQCCQQPARQVTEQMKTLLALDIHKSHWCLDQEWATEKGILQWSKERLGNAYSVSLGE